jgi:uncharacterized membrane protein (UPF0127 family)
MGAMNRGLLALAVLLMLVAPASFWGGRPLHAAQLQTLEIVTKTGVRNFSVELAVTDAELDRGLMFRRELPEGRGMLFDFKRDQPLTMWMKDTPLTLDMIFIRSDGSIARIFENAKPLSTRTISSGSPVRAVLEVPGGSARRLGIEPGNRVLHPIFRAR